MLPSSPRRRRRLMWIGLTLAFVLAAAGTLFLLPGGPKQEPERFHGKADLARSTSTAVDHADRLAITGTLQRFMAAGLARGDLAEAWSLAGPGLRAGTERSGWLSGSVPFIQYAAGPFGADAWRAVDATPHEVVLDLLVQPRPGSKDGPTTFTVDVARVGSAWKVQSIYPAVMFSAAGQKPRVFSEKDLAPGPGGGEPPHAEARLSAAWLLAPVALFVSLLIAVAVAVARQRRRATA